jgi:hypothetical protein
VVGSRPRAGPGPPLWLHRRLLRLGRNVGAGFRDNQRVHASAKAHPPARLRPATLRRLTPAGDAATVPETCSVSPSAPSRGSGGSQARTRGRAQVSPSASRGSRRDGGTPTSHDRGAPRAAQDLGRPRSPVGRPRSGTRDCGTPTISPSFDDALTGGSLRRGRRRRSAAAPWLCNQCLGLAVTMPGQPSVVAS